MPPASMPTSSPSAKGLTGMSRKRVWTEIIIIRIIIEGGKIWTEIIIITIIMEAEGYERNEKKLE